MAYSQRALRLVRKNFVLFCKYLTGRLDQLAFPTLFGILPLAKAEAGTDVSAGETMSAAGVQTANVIDFNSYRARRVRTTTAGHGSHTWPAGATFAFWPVMIPVVTWVPVWQAPPVTGQGKAS
jgi:hypothetical protein